ncbi:MAG: PLP-dependent aminotransferase family protein [Synergistales bacterium]|nr:PLP-dependent aminotransferase family protein [Synergistales bacterium]
MLEIPLHRGTATPLYRQIAEHLKVMIDRGALAAGFRLPGTREMARALSVSRTTTAEAYSLLVSEGYVIEKGRSGSFVAPRPSPALTARAVSDEILWDLASERPSPGLLAKGSVGRLLRSLLSKGDPELFVPAPMEGLAALRQALVHHGVLRGIPVQSEQLVVTGGGIEGLSTALAALKAQGVSRIWVEDLTFPDVFAMAQAETMEIRSLPLEEAALLAGMGQLGEGEAVYLIPSFHNPTGRTLSFEARQALLALGRKRRFWIIEDDTYGEFRYGSTSVPALKSLDEADRVIYIGSFSQLFFPGLRVGYALLPPSLRESFLAVKAKRQGPVSTLAQRAALAFIGGGDLDSGLVRLRSILSRRMDALVSALRRDLPGLPVCKPQGGIYLWLPTVPCDGKALAASARSRGVALAAGESFAWPPRSVEGVRFSVSRLDGAAITGAVRVLKEAWRF